MSLTTNDLFCVCMHVCEMCDKTLKKCRLYPISARKRHDVIMRARERDRSTDRKLRRARSRKK